MREIKFRAWLKTENQMFYPPKLSLFFREGIKANFHYKRFSKEESHGVSNKDYVLMQFTGLKDKNGVEIYFGDIVELDGCKAVVKFDNTIFALYLDPLDEDDWCEDWEADDLCRFEVIGNTYQHKHLLA